MLVITACSTSMTETTFVVLDRNGNGTWKGKHLYYPTSNIFYKLTPGGAMYLAANIYA
jgi:hypothetical protein